MDTKKAILLIVVVSFLFRFAPLAVHEMPLSYDAWFHVRSSQKIIESGSIPEFEDSLSLKANNYPPFYHLFIARAHFFLGLPEALLGAVALPFFSSLIALSVFVLVRRAFGDKKALIASFFGAVFVPLIVSAYDSPENVLFFLLPVVLFLFLIKKQTIATYLYVSGFFWNYFFMLVSIPAFLIAFWKDKKTVQHFFAGLFLFGLINLLLKGPSFFQTQSLKTGMDFIFGNIRQEFPAIAVLASLLFIAIVFFAREKTPAPQKNFLSFFGGFSVLLMLSFVFTSILRPWEQVKFAGIAGVLLAPFIPLEGAGKKFLVFLGAFMVFGALFVSTNTMFPAISKNDVHAFEALEKLEKNDPGRVLAQPSLAEFARANYGYGDSFLTSLYFENPSEEEFLEESLKYLSGQSLENEEEYFEKTGAKYVLLNFEDSALRGTEKFEEKNFLNKVYAVSFKNSCIGGIFGKTAGFDCGENEAKIFKYSGKTQ